MVSLSTMLLRDEVTQNAEEEKLNEKKKKEEEEK